MRSECRSFSVGHPVSVSVLRGTKPGVPWRFLTNHGRVLLCLAHDPDLRIRDLALVLGITERSTQKILGDLVKAGYVTRSRVGRRNAYEVHVERPLPIARELNVDHLLHTFSVDSDVDQAALSAAAAQRLD
jgi:predicted transcriptional regulator